MDWRYPDDEQILEITERQYENVFENLLIVLKNITDVNITMHTI